MLKEILIERIKESVLKVNGNAPSGLKEKDITKRGTRIFEDGKILTSSFVGDIDDEDLFASAKRNTASALNYEYELPKIISVQKKCLIINEWKDQDYFKNYLSALDTLKAKYPNFVFSGSCNFMRNSRSLKNNNGVFHSIDADIFSWHFLFKDKTSANIIDGYFGANSIGKYNIDREIDHFMKILDVHNTIINIEESKLPVIFLMQSQLMPKITESFRIDNYHQDIGVFKGKLGESIVSNRISLVDSIFKPEKGSINLFDGDGLSRENPDLPLIENGVFTNLISDLRNAKKYKSTSTANGIRNYKSSVALGFNDLLFKDGTKTPSELLAGLDKCIIVCMAAGGEFTNEGDFATPVQFSYLMEKGQYVGRLPQLTLKSSLRKMLTSDFIEITKGNFAGMDNNSSLVMLLDVIKN